MGINGSSNRFINRKAAAGVLALAATGAAVAGVTTANAAGSANTFHLQRSQGIVTAGCLPHARARVSITSRGPVEDMRVQARGLPKHREFDLFVIQVPDAPFGVSWYQGDLHTGSRGRAAGHFVGRFNQETFAVAPEVAPAPQVHHAPIPDATSNPKFGPVHTFHVGIWFNSPKAAAKAGCPTATTPFNGEHNAGVQVLNTGQFPDQHGPIGRLRP